MARFEVLSGGTVFAGGSAENVSAGSIAYARVRQDSYAGCAMNETRHTTGYWSGAFCAGPDCVLGWTAWSGTFAV